jgi:hypothetical protein
MTFFLLIRDIYYLFKILKMYDGCKAYYNIENELNDEQISKERELLLYN